MRTRQPAERTAEPENIRTRRYAQIERMQGEEGSHPAARLAIQRCRDARSGRRMQEFLRIARGRET